MHSGPSQSMTLDSVAIQKDNGEPAYRVTVEDTAKHMSKVGLIDIISDTTYEAGFKFSLTALGVSKRDQLLQSGD